jgi:hypothetical protein
MPWVYFYGILCLLILIRYRKTSVVRCKAFVHLFFLLEKNLFSREIEEWEKHLLLAPAAWHQ